MATLHDQDAGTNDSTGQGLATANAVTTAANDCSVVGFKHEGTTAGGYTCTDTSSNTYSAGNAVVSHTGTSPANDLQGLTYYSLITSGTSITPTAGPTSNKTFRKIKCLTFTPAASKVFQLYQTAAAQGTSNAPNAGNVTVDQPGFVVLFAHLYGTRTPTAATNWLIPSEFSSADGMVMQYRLVTGSEGSIAASMTLNSSIEWIAQAMYFKEVDPVSAVKHMGLLGVG